MDRNVYEACSDLIKRYKSYTAGPDEVLAEKLDHLVPIPFLTREELEKVASNDRDQGLYTGELIPSIDLRVLHYYATQLCLKKYPHLLNKFDDSSLISLGLLVEKWVKDFLVARQDRTKINPGVSQMLSKIVNYEEDPANI
ncbi:hypothetical protein TPHA_0C02860 [Tetrapisispora phaffii CBS 4417]|uniref:Uncharacterized protein n=1 Tax=Tetrapisispora phaffii (strain ATCC 24235 / CBS 4417 / NBRC 1672 / NRRL Y-8282 / UCD 70-5) TaxID=1071381 RepID=G8BRR3_TETPH|nr:hypothetical protein TPHA_0C02860 [Tetrapisispora phaffii CBS 4417]CCE62439.1 hypothetical protein TPHA_0C02860 [Tetrapisispora phaffii CBS 4417]